MENEVLIERARAFVQAVAAQAPWAEIEPYYAPDVSQEEFLDRLLPKGAVRNLEALRDASATRKVIKAPSIWTGTLAVDFGTLKPVDQLRARFAQIFEFKDGLIWRQRNY